jgi:hypothetical protein
MQQAANTITRENSDLMYEALKSMSEGLIKNQSVESFLQNNPAFGNLNSDSLTGLGICFKVAKEVNSADEFWTFIGEKEIPPIKLSNKEMELLKGGWVNFAIQIAYIAVNAGVEHYTQHSIPHWAGVGIVKLAKALKS